MGVHVVSGTGISNTVSAEVRDALQACTGMGPSALVYHPSALFQIEAAHADLIMARPRTGGTLEYKTLAAPASPTWSSAGASGRAAGQWEGPTGHRASP